MPHSSHLLRRESEGFGVLPKPRLVLRDGRQPNVTERTVDGPPNAAHPVVPGNRLPLLVDDDAPRVRRARIRQPMSPKVRAVAVRSHLPRDGILDAGLDALVELLALEGRDDVISLHENPHAACCDGWVPWGVSRPGVPGEHLDFAEAPWAVEHGGVWSIARRDLPGTSDGHGVGLSRFLRPRLWGRNDGAGWGGRRRGRRRGRRGGRRLCLPGRTFRNLPNSPSMRPSQPVLIPLLFLQRIERGVVPSLHAKLRKALVQPDKRIHVSLVDIRVDGRFDAALKRCQERRQGIIQQGKNLRIHGLPAEVSTRNRPGARVCVCHALGQVELPLQTAAHDRLVDG